MTGGQTAMLLDEDSGDGYVDPDVAGQHAADASHAELEAIAELPVILATAEESTAHEAMLERIRKSGACVWDID